MEQRRFEGIWIPKEIWLDDKLTALEKSILMEIHYLDNGNHCYANNKYFADFCKCSESRVSQIISKLEKLKYISILKFDGRKRVIKSNLKFIVS